MVCGITGISRVCGIWYDREVYGSQYVVYGMTGRSRVLGGVWYLTYCIRRWSRVSGALYNKKEGGV